MKLYTVLAGLALAALVAAFGVHRWLMAEYAPGMTSVGAFLDAAPVVKMIMVSCLLALIGVTIMALIGVATAAAKPSGGEIEVALALTAAGAILFGLLGAAYGEMNTQIAISRVGPVSFAVTAPSRAEALLCLSYGLFTGVTGFAGAAGIAALRRRRRPEAD